jgi:hypothetical protein
MEDWFCGGHDVEVECRVLTIKYKLQAGGDVRGRCRVIWACGSIDKDTEEANSSKTR